MSATPPPPAPWSSPAELRGRRPLRFTALLVLVVAVQILATASAAPGPPVRAEPVQTGELAIGLVLDGSEIGRPALPGGVSGATDFVLAASSSTRIALVVDTTPPALVVPLRNGRAEAVRGLAAVQARGDRQTGAALDLAMRQLHTDTAQPRLLVLYTGAADAGGEPAAELAHKLIAAGVVLAVVSPAGDDQLVPPYWSTVATGTGGVAASARPSQVVAAFEQVATAAASRYPQTFPVPAQLTPRTTATVKSGDGSLTADAPVAADAVLAGGTVATQRSGAEGFDVLSAAAAAVVLLLAVGATVVAACGRTAPSVGPARRRVTAPAPLRPALHVGSGTRSGSVVARSPTTTAAGRAWNIPARSVLLPGHKRLLAAVGRTLQAGDPALLSVAEGSAGTGATTAVIEFSHRHRHDYDIAWWIPAADPELVPDRLAALAEVLGLADRTDEAEAATFRLLQALRYRDRYLLVFAEAENPHQLARFLPQGGGHVVIISADRRWQAHAAPHTVGPFTRAESVALLCARRPDLTVEEAGLIATTLGDLPLAVDPAAALLTHTGMGAEDFLRRLSDRAAQLRADDRCGRDCGGGRDHSAAATWALAFDQLAADDPAAFALLTTVAWMGNEPVPLQLFTDHPRHLPDSLGPILRNPDTLRRAMAILHRRGLARVASGTVQLHRVPAALLVARSTGESPGEYDWAATTVRLLRAAVPRNPGSDPGVRRAWRQLIPLVLTATDPARPLDAVVADVGWLLDNTAGYLHARGLRYAAEALFRDAHDLGHDAKPVLQRADTYRP